MRLLKKFDFKKFKFMILKNIDFLVTNGMIETIKFRINNVCI